MVVDSQQADEALAWGREIMRSYRPDLMRRDYSDQRYAHIADQVEAKKAKRSSAGKNPQEEKTVVTDENRQVVEDSSGVITIPAVATRIPEQNSAVSGWREEFNDPQLPVAVIGFNAGGTTQNEENFEKVSTDGGPWIREAQRLGVDDVGDPEHTAFLPAYDMQVKGLHPGKKREHGWRAARWALSEVYDNKFLNWSGDNTKLPVNPDIGGRALSGMQERDRKKEAQARLEYRRMEEAKRAVEILERLETLGQ